MSSAKRGGRLIPEGGSKVSDQVAAAFSLAGVVGVGSCGGAAVGKELKPHTPPGGDVVSPDQVGIREGPEGFRRFGCLIKAGIGEANIK